MTHIKGKSLGHYQILEQLGEGGMAVVYKALDMRLEREVAIKVIRRGAFPPDQLARILKRFEREAKALARLIHPNIVPIVDYGEHEGEPYLVMPHLPGGTLKGRLGRPVPWHEAIRLLVPIARALHYAHEQWIVHRDVKPSNVLITQSGEPMLTDFGIAKILMDTNETSDLTGTGIGIGTPEYMSPEQFQNKGVDARTDIYSLGVVLFELITGRKPYEADTPAAVLIKQATTPLPKLGKIVSGIPDGMEKVVAKALAQDVNQRFPHMAAFADAMEGLLHSQIPSRRSNPKVVESKPSITIKDNTLVETKPASSKRTGVFRRGLLLGGLVILIGSAWLVWGTVVQEKKSGSVFETASAEELIVASNGETQVTQASLNLDASPTSNVTATPNPYSIPAPEYAISRIGKGTVYALTFSPDGETLAVSTGSGVCLYDFDEMQLEQVIPDISPYIAFSPDGKQLAVGKAIWDIENGSALALPDTLTSGELLGVAFRESIPIVSKEDASTGNVLELWNIMTGQKIGDVYRNGTWAYNPIISPDGQLLVIQSSTGNINDPSRTEILDTLTRKVLTKFDGYYLQAAFSHDSSLLVTIHRNNEISVYDLIERRQTYQFEVSHISHDYGNQPTLALSPDGKWLASSQPPDILRIWDLASGEESATLTDIFTDVYSFSPDGQYLIVADGVNVNVIDWRTGEIAKQATGFGLPIRSMSGYDEGRLFANLDQKVLLTVGIENRSMSTVEIIESPIQIGLVSPDGSLVVGFAKDDSGSLTLWNTVTNELTYIQNPEQSELFFTGQTESIANIYDYQLEGYLWRRYYYPVYSADGRFTAECETDRKYNFNEGSRTYTSIYSELSIIKDLNTQQQIKTVNGCAPLFSADGSLIVTSANAVMDSQTGDVLYTFEDPGSVTSKAFSPDKAVLAIGLENGNLLLDILATGQRREFEGHTAAITSIVFLPDSQQMATGSADGTIIIWDLNQMLP